VFKCTQCTSLTTQALKVAMYHSCTNYCIIDCFSVLFFVTLKRTHTQTHPHTQSSPSLLLSTAPVPFNKLLCCSGRRATVMPADYDERQAIFSFSVPLSLYSITEEHLARPSGRQPSEAAHTYNAIGPRQDPPGPPSGRSSSRPVPSWPRRTPSAPFTDPGPFALPRLKDYG
jgi:hypothetical protein